MTKYGTEDLGIWRTFATAALCGLTSQPTRPVDNDLVAILSAGFADEMMNQYFKRIKGYVWNEEELIPEEKFPCNWEELDTYIANVRSCKQYPPIPGVMGTTGVQGSSVPVSQDVGQCNGIVDINEKPHCLNLTELMVMPVHYCTNCKITIVGIYTCTPKCPGCLEKMVLCGNDIESDAKLFERKPRQAVTMPSYYCGKCKDTYIGEPPESGECPRCHYLVQRNKKSEE